MAYVGNFFGYYECVFQEDCHAQDEVFKVTIPSLFNITDQFEAKESETISNDPNSIATKNNKDVGDYSYGTIIYAKNHTDYHFQIRGDVFKKNMDSTDGITETKSGGTGDPAFEEHDHDIKQSITLNNFTYENLNNVAVPKLSKGYGFFINGIMDPNGFVVVRIEGVVPLNADKAKKVGYKR